MMIGKIVIKVMYDFKIKVDIYSTLKWGWSVIWCFNGYTLKGDHMQNLWLVCVEKISVNENSKLKLTKANYSNDQREVAWVGNTLTTR